MISWNRNIRNPHSSIKGPSYRCRANFIITNYMYSLNFFLLIYSFKNNIRIITIIRRIIIIKKFKTLFLFCLIMHWKRKMTHFTSYNSPLIGICGVSAPCFFFLINPHSKTVNMNESNRARAFAWTYKWIYFYFFFLVR